MSVEEKLLDDNSTSVDCLNTPGLNLKVTELNNKAIQMANDRDEPENAIKCLK